ncbi:4Fe-4S binding protein [bacterium]|nr:4Fe-4S binding protein [bacterium]
MAYKIDSASCISCGACVVECPVDAISPGDDTYLISVDKCVDCGECVSVCPMDCIAPDEHNSEE